MEIRQVGLASTRCGGTTIEGSCVAASDLPDIVASCNALTANCAASCPAHGTSTLQARPSSRRDAQVNDLAAVRSLKASQRAEIDDLVNDRMQQLAQEAYRVPWLYVEITGSLPTASALCIIERCSDQARKVNGNAWVRLPRQRWLNFTGLDADQWLAARQALRHLGVIRERRCCDFAAGQITTEIAFVQKVFAMAVTRLQAILRDRARQAIKAGRSA